MLLYGVMGLKDLVKLKIEDGILERKEERECKCGARTPTWM